MRSTEKTNSGILSLERKRFHKEKINKWAILVINRFSKNTNGCLKGTKRKKKKQGHPCQTKQVPLKVPFFKMNTQRAFHKGTVAWDRKRHLVKRTMFFVSLNSEKAVKIRVEKGHRKLSDTPSNPDDFRCGSLRGKFYFPGFPFWKGKLLLRILNAWKTKQPAPIFP